MKKLKTAGLYGAELLQISGDLVTRYNQALALLGFTPTTLSVFEIDSIGWSPQIAEEKSNPHYLCHGEANPYGIIVSPAQQGSPVYFPFHSFDRELIDHIYSHYYNAIIEITQTTAICIDIDQDIEAFDLPTDLLRYANIRVGFQILGDKAKAKSEQMVLVDQFMDGENHLDLDIHSSILASARKHGDLRSKEVSLDSITAQVASFYTRSFGGVFIIREGFNHEPIIVVQDKKVLKEAMKVENVMVYHINDPDLLSLMEEIGWLDIDKSYYRNDSSRIDRIKEMLFAQAITKAKVTYSINEVLESKALMRKFKNELKPKQLEQYTKFCKVVDQCIDGDKDVDKVSQEMHHTLYHPTVSLDESTSSLMWQLLGKVYPIDPFMLYKHDKEEFYKVYQSYEEPLKEWVTQVVITYNQKKQ